MYKSNIYTLKELKELFGYSQKTGFAEMGRANKYIKRLRRGEYLVRQDTPIEEIKTGVRGMSRLVEEDEGSG